MPQVSGKITVEDLLSALGLAAIPSGSPISSLRLEDRVDFDDVEVCQSEIDDEASDADPELIEVNSRDLRDGLQSLLAGDYRMAGIMLQRALEGHDDAQRVVEEEIRAAARKRAA